MHTLVVNGEPIVYGDSWGPGDFRRFMHEVTGECDHNPDPDSVPGRIRTLINQSYEETNRRDRESISLRISEKTFGFVATECCAGKPQDERYPYDEHYSVLVMKKDRWGHKHLGYKHIHGCCCADCSDARVWSGRIFLREQTGVRFNV
jgi:hypothetical protein